MTKTYRRQDIEAELTRAGYRCQASFQDQIRYKRGPYSVIVRFGKVELDYSVPDFDEPTSFFLVDFSKWYCGLGRGMYMTTSDEPGLTNYMYTGVPVSEFMEIATGPENRIPMAVQNRVNEKALEELE